MKRNLVFFKKLKFWSNVSFGQRQFCSGAHAKKSRQKSFFLVLKGRKNWKQFIFFGKEVFLQVFPGHKQSSFDNSAAIFLLIRNFDAQSAKFFVKFTNLQTNCFRPKIPLDTKNPVSTLPLLKFLLKVNFSSAQSSRKGPRCTHLSRIIFSQSVCWTQELHVWRPRRNFLILSNFCLLKFWRKREKYSS